MDPVAIFKQKMTFAILALPERSPAARQSVYRKTRQFITFSKYAHLAPALEQAIDAVEAEFLQPLNVFPDTSTAPAPAATIHERFSLASWTNAMALLIAMIGVLLFGYWLLSGATPDPDFDRGFAQYSSSPRGFESIATWSTYYDAGQDGDVTFVEAHGQVPLYSKEVFPVERGKAYRVSTRIRIVTDDPARQGSLSSVGIVPLDARGDTIGKDFRAAIFGAMNLKPMTSRDGWVVGEGTMTFDSSDETKRLPEATTAVRLVAKLNEGSPGAVSQIDYLRFDEIPNP